MTFPFRFGVMLGQPVASAGEWRELARRVEALGYDTLSLPNHLAHQPLAPMVALAVAAEATERLRVGTLVVDNESVHPAIIANEAATLDLLSDGRLELGIGAGWLPTDHSLINQPFPAASARVERLEESVQIIKRCWTEEKVSFQGTHYQVEGLPGVPRPVQRPHPPILIGGGGRRVLEVAARHANIVSVVPNMSAGRVGPESAASATGDATRTKVAWVREAAGSRFAGIELASNVTLVRVTDDRHGALEKVARAYGVDVGAAAEVPHALVGSVDQIVEDCERRREEYGISYLTIFAPGMEAAAPVVEALSGR